MKMQFTILILSLIANIALSQPVEKCQVYKCQYSDIACILHNDDNYYLSVCNSSYPYCPTDDYKFQCQRPKQDLLKTGRKCNQNSSCGTLECNEGICQGKQTNQTCLSHQDCHLGLACKNFICIEQLEEGEQCFDHFMCKNHYFCKQQKCTKYFQQADNEEIQDVETCDPSIVYYECSSGACDEVNSKIVCKNSQVKSVNSPLSECIKDEDCNGDAPDSYNYKGHCSCGYSNDDKKFCLLHPGDDEFKLTINF